MSTDSDDLSAAAQPQPIQFERRVVLGSVLAVSVASLLPIDPRRAARAATPAKAVLPAELLMTLDAFADRIIPADENGPGARAAGAATYIDRSLGDWNAGELSTLSAGLRAMDAFARSRFATGFTALSDAQKDELLTAMEAGQAEGFADAQSLFNRLRGLTLEGTFSDPHYGGNRNFIGWDLIGYPGAVLASTPEMQRLGGRLPPLHVSAYGGSHDGH